MDWWNNLLIIVIVFGGLLFLSAIGALFWASRNGQLDEFEEGARSIFPDDEPEDAEFDGFPGAGEKRSRKKKDG